MELYWIKSKSIDDIEEKNLRTLRLWWAISFSLFTFFQGGSRRGSSLFSLFHPVKFHQIPPGHLYARTL